MSPPTDSASLTPLWATSSPMSTSSAQRAETFGATSGATTSGTSAPRFEVLNSPNGPNYFFFQRFYGWSSLTQPGARPFQGAPRRLKPVEGLSSGSHVRKTKTPFFACHGMRPWTPVMAFLTEATPAHEFGSTKDPLPSKTTMLHLSITPDTASKGLRTLAPWNVFSSRCHPSHRVVRCELLLSVLTRLSIFSRLGPTYRYPFTEPFDGFKSTFGQSSGFTTDSPALESTVPTSLTICCDRFAVDGHVANCDCVQVHLVRPPLSIIGVVARSVFSFTGDVILWRFN